MDNPDFWLSMLDTSIAIAVCLIAIIKMAEASAECRRATHETSKEILRLLSEVMKSEK